MGQKILDSRVAAAVVVCVVAIGVGIVAAEAAAAVEGTRYTPVIMMHGIDGHATDFSNIIENLQRTHPGQFTHSIPMFEGIASWTPLWNQVGICASRTWACVPL